MIIKCLYCGNTTKNPKYCSRSCAAKENNKTPKRKRTRKCSQCDELTRNYKSSLCEYHFQIEQQNKTEYIKNLTIEDYIKRGSVKGKHPSWKFVHIRGLNRSWNADLTKKPCHNCGYSKHVELAHIIPVSAFPITTKLRVVNSPKNVVQLCRNCHWEFDNKLITLASPDQL